MNDRQLDMNEVLLVIGRLYLDTQIALGRLAADNAKLREDAGEKTEKPEE